jgi:hypothetical protein
MNKTATAGGLGSGVLTIWLLGQIGIEVPAEVAAAIAAGLMPLAVWAGEFASAWGERWLSWARKDGA